MSASESDKGKKLRNFDVSRTVNLEELHSNVLFQFENKVTGAPLDIWIPETHLNGKAPSEVKTIAERTYEVFRRAERWEEERDIDYVNEKRIRAA